MNRKYWWALTIAAVALLFAGTLFTRYAAAQGVNQKGQLITPKDPSPLYVITFTDVTPENVGKGTELVKQYALETKKDPGNVRSELLAQNNRTNHFVLLQVWENTAAFEKHEEAQHTKDFRATLTPMLGAPFDQRLNFQVQ